MYKKLSYFLCLAVFTSVSHACAASENLSTSNQASESQPAQRLAPQSRQAFYKSSRYRPTGLLHHLDFEDEKIIPLEGGNGSYDRLITKLPTGDSTSLGIMYEGGKESDRRARIVADPEDAKNHVLHYWLKNATVPVQVKGRYKGRIQLNFGDLNKFTLFQRYRLYLHPDLNLYRQYPGHNVWFGLATFWMGAPWTGDEYPFKISLNIAKPAGVNSALYFVAGGGIFAGGEVRQGKWKDVWAEVGKNFEVPVAEWIDIEIGYRAGDDNSGRFYLGAKKAGDAEITTVLDVTDWTYHPDAPNPVPVTILQPLKLYSSGRIIDFIRSKGGVAQLYWDDLEVYEKW
jgi:hypothetical protein